MELSYREEVQHTILDVLQSVVVLLEDHFRRLQVQPALRLLRPRQVRDDLQVRANDLRLGGLSGDALQPAQLSVDLLARLLGDLQGFEALTELLDFLAVDVLPQLLVDRLQLLAQEDLALPLAELLLDLRSDLFLRFEDADLPLQVDKQLPQAVLDGQGLEKLLLLIGFELGVEGDEIG